MIKEEFEIKRETRLVEFEADLAVVGGGLSGVCIAVTAARNGNKVVLFQDRPVLGGNASSEIRLWALGATSHMGNNNRWAREGGLINEILLENLRRNREGNPLILDTIILEKVVEEDNIELLLNTSVYEVEKSGDQIIKSVTGFCSQNSTTYKVSSGLFCDASGDGIVAFKAGATFRMGAEPKEEFDEGFAPNVEDYGNLLGHSMYFYTKETNASVKYIPPSFAIKDAGKLPRIKNYKVGEYGCRLWWVEYGGRLDTIHQSEEIKFELWKVLYGIWDYIKNSGKFPESVNQTLEWVGTIPGKRESRRFEGDFMLTQKDIVEQRDYYDAVAHGGWAMDLHPADGVYSDHDSCTQWHSKGVYTIPYRCYYSKDINNLFLAGRIISASHVAFGSSRVMLTCALGAQAVGEAVSLCLEHDLLPRGIAEDDSIMQKLQLRLNRKGQSIPRVKPIDEEDIARKAKISASSTNQFKGFRPGDQWQQLEFSTAQLLPLKSGKAYQITFEVKAKQATILNVELKTSSTSKHFTPDLVVEHQEFSLLKGKQEITFVTSKNLAKDQYVYISLLKNEDVQIRLSEERITGIMTVQNKINKQVSNFGKQEPPVNIGIDSFEFWTPERRPKGQNMAFELSEFLDIFHVKNIANGHDRPEPNGKANAWVASGLDKTPTLKMSWDKPQHISEINIFFDCDYDHALESTLMGHPESRIPFIVKNYMIEDGNGAIIARVEDNYQAINRFIFNKDILTKSLIFKFKQNDVNIPVSVFAISIY